MKKMFLMAVVAVALMSGAQAQDRHVVQAPKDAQWGAAPPFLPPGAEIAIVSGDPTKSVPYTVRLKFPAGYAIPSHSHPTDENVVVTTGAVTFGMGDKLAKNGVGNKTLGVGGAALMPAGMNHYAFTAAESAIVLYGTGPVEFKYVNPNDDPRNGKKMTSR